MSTMTLTRETKSVKMAEPKRMVMPSEPELKTTKKDMIIVAAVGLLVLGLTIAGIISIGNGNAGLGQSYYVYGF